MYKRRLAPAVISATRRATRYRLYIPSALCCPLARHYLIDSVVLAATARDEKRARITIALPRLSIKRRQRRASATFIRRVKIGAVPHADAARETGKKERPTCASFWRNQKRRMNKR